MTDLFFGCQYVSGKVKLPNGALVDQKRFNVIYGGHEFDLGCGHFDNFLIALRYATGCLGEPLESWATFA